jgi:cytoskeletal protein RodZ
LNRVFEVIGFVYPDYSYPSQKQGKKRSADASVISTTPKPKKIKVLTHRPRHIETAEVLKLDKGPSSALELSYPAPVEAKMESVEEPKLKIAAEQVKALSPLQETEQSKVQKVVLVTPKRRRMASVLDAVMESTKALTPTSAEAPSVEVKNTKKSAEADMT